MEHAGATSAHAPHEHAKPRILVVDDEPVNLLVLQGVLRGEGFDALTAGSGQEARSVAAAEQPDLILLDIMMPGESGFQTCSRLKESPDTMDIPIIFISALTDVENKVRGLELGAVDYIGKPFEKAEVLARVRLHVKLERAKKKLIAEQAAKLQQLADAQQALLVRPADAPQANFDVCYVPSLEVGGDFYDVFSINDDACFYFIADICGHDISASFATSSLKALIRQNTGPLFTPEETLKTINSVLATVIYGGRYLTAQSLQIDRHRQRAVLANAGHPGPIFCPKGGSPRLVDAPGDILGVFSSIYVASKSIEVAPGDRFFLYTDGLLERFRSPRRTLAQGEEALLRAILEYADRPLPGCSKAIVESLDPNVCNGEDDVMLMVIEV